MSGSNSYQQADQIIVSRLRKAAQDIMNVLQVKSPVSSYGTGQYWIEICNSDDTLTETPEGNIVWVTQTSRFQAQLPQPGDKLCLFTSGAEPQCNRVLEVVEEPVATGTILTIPARVSETFEFPIALSMLLRHSQVPSTLKTILAAHLKTNSQE